MEIILKKNWDAPISIPETGRPEEGFFVGREMEIQLLKNDILRKDQGSILISGHRGVGKTTLVYKALQEVYKEILSPTAVSVSETQQREKHLAGKQVLLVLINAGQLDTNSLDGAPQISPELILKTIIRRLYTTAKGIDLGKTKKDLENLYKKAVAKEFKLQEKLLQLKEQSQEMSRKNEKGVQFKRLSRVQVVHLLFLIAGAGVIFLAPWQRDIINKIVGLLLVIPIPAAINWSISKSEIKKNNNVDTQSAELLYQIDNNVSNLEYDLEEFHKKLNNDHWKIVYVIDELDKLGDITNVAKVIKYFKNLFTLSKALFLFIGNEDIYKESTLEEKGGSFRPEQYTYFTSKYFISRPTWDELVAFMDNSMATPPMGTKDENLLRVQYYLAHEAGNDFFNLINVIKDNISKYDENGCPVLDIDMNNPDNIMKSRFHKCQMVLFSRKYYVRPLARRYENEQLLRQLMKYTAEIISSSRPTEFSDPGETGNSAAMKRDYNNLLSRLDVFSVREGQLSANGSEIPTRVYSYNGYFKKDPPDRLNIYSEQENRFIALSLEYLQSILPLINWYKQTEEVEYSIDQLRRVVEGGMVLSQLLPFELLFPPPSWQETFVMISTYSFAEVLSREKVESQIKLLEEKKAWIMRALFSLVVKVVRRGIEDSGFSSVDPMFSFENKRRLDFYGKEIEYAIQNEDLAIFYDEQSGISHVLVKPDSDLLALAGEAHRDSHKVYVIANAAQQIMALKDKETFYSTYLVENTEALLAQAYLLIQEIKNNHRPYVEGRSFTLSEQEIAFLKLVCTELTYMEIAKELNVSPRTVDKYRERLFEKLDLRTRVGLAVYALKNGIVSERGKEEVS